MTEFERLARIEDRLHEASRNLAVLEANFRTAERSHARALEIQANEYERRLSILNGEAAKLSLMQATYLPREIYDRDIARMQKDIADLKESRTIPLSIVSGLSVLIALLVSLLVSRIT